MRGWPAAQGLPMAPSALGPKIKAKSELGRCMMDQSLGMGKKK